MTPVPSMVGGRYRVVRELGRGGMGAVYLVEHVHTGEQLALKVLLAPEALGADAIERFKREARAPAKIRSEHVVRVTDADVAAELGGAPFMVMEALQGKDLEALVEARGALPPAEVVWILEQVASALDKAHAIGIVHRDLKPENLYLHTKDDGSFIVKILDFGISKIRDGDVPGLASAGLTQTGAVMGTPLYMSPEQARGQATSIGPPTDIWALGLVTVRLLTGDMYWHSVETLPDLLMKIMVDPMVPPSARFPHLGQGFDRWFLRSCDRDPARRYASVGEQVRDLAAALLPAHQGARTVKLEAPAMELQSTQIATATVLAAPLAAPYLQTTSGAAAMSRSSGAGEVGRPSSGRGLLWLGVVAILALGSVATLYVTRTRSQGKTPVVAVAAPPASPTVEPVAVAVASSAAPVLLAAPPAAPAVTSGAASAVPLKSPPRSLPARITPVASTPGNAFNPEAP